MHTRYPCEQKQTYIHTYSTRVHNICRKNTQILFRSRLCTGLRSALSITWFRRHVLGSVWSTCQSRFYRRRVYDNPRKLLFETNIKSTHHVERSFNVYNITMHQFTKLYISCSPQRNIKQYYNNVHPSFTCHRVLTAFMYM